MTEDFLTRWMRLKRETAAQPAPRSDATMTDSAPVPLERRATPPIDPARLPPIDSISAESSVAAFLQAGVPEDLTRAALRNAWATDPAIRDFVGIAENQWDFNGEDTIAGFGPLSVEEYARYVAARALRAEPGVSATQEGDDPGEDASENALAPKPPGDCTQGSRTTSPAPHSCRTARESINRPQIATATPESASQTSSPSPPGRTHGSALPK